MIRIVVSFVFAGLFAVSGHAADSLEAFPPAEAGMTRHVLRLPEKEDESRFKVELVVGKTVETDGANRHFFGGRLEAETVKGWGFTRHVLGELGPMAGTRMAAVRAGRR